MSNLPISKRAANTLDIECSLDRVNTLVREKLLDPEFNPNAVLNLGLAHNDLLQEKVFEKVELCGNFLLCFFSTHNHFFY